MTLLAATPSAVSVVQLSPGLFVVLSLSGTPLSGAAASALVFM